MRGGAGGGRGDGAEGRVALVLVFGLLAVLAIRQVGNPDIGFHLKAGEYILSGHGWPANDPFTYTLKDHAYIDTSWGYQVLLASIQRVSGSAGIVLFHAILVLLIFYTVYRTTRLGESDFLTLVPVFLLGALASEMRFEARPEVLSWLFLVLVLHLLHRRARKLPSPLWLLPVIHLIWANCHSLFILGWGAMGCFLIGGILRDRRLDRALLRWSLASVAVTILNPYGWKGTLFPFTLATRMASGNVFAESIGEFVSPFNLRLPPGFPFYPVLPIFSFRILAVLALVSLLPLFRRKRWDLCLLAAAFLVLAAGMIRNMPLLVLAGLPGMAWAFPAEKLLEKIRLGADGIVRFRRVGLALLSLLTIALGLRVFHDAYYIADRRPSRFGLEWNRILLPLDAADFAVRAGLAGPVLNHLNLGATLMWKLPQPVFIDGRLEVVGERFYQEYLAILGTEEGMEAAVARYGIQWTIFPYAINPRLLGRLSRDPRWRLAYVDHLAVIFAREGTAAAGRIDPSLNRLLAQDPRRPEIRSLPGLGGPPRRGAVARWVSGLFRREDFPNLSFNLGLFHIFRGEPVRAGQRFAEAIRESGGAYFEFYADLAAALYPQRRLDEARACDRIVLESDPSNPLARARLSGTPPPIR